MWHFLNLHFLQISLFSNTFLQCIFSESFLNKVIGLQVSQPHSARKVQKVDKVHLFADHDGKVLLVGETVLADANDPEDRLLGLFHILHGSKLQSSDRVDLIVARALQTSDSYNLLLCTYLITGLEHALGTFQKFMIVEYYPWGTR